MDARSALLIVLSLSASADVFGKKFMIYGGQSNNTYLGCLTCDKYDPESVHNEYSAFGNEYARESIYNRYSDYGSEFSQYGACNPYATSPPIVVDEEGDFYGRLTINEFKQPIDAPEIIAWLRRLCIH